MARLRSNERVRVYQATIEEFLDGLSPEMLERIEATRTAMAEKFDLPKEDFEAVPVAAKDGTSKLVVLLASGLGINKGVWNQIFDSENEDDFMVEIDGTRVDTRRAMTWEAYQAWIELEEAQGTHPLPDSDELVHPLGQERRGGTWMTGDPVYTGEDGSEPPTVGIAGVYTNARQFPIRHWDFLDGRYSPGVLFRPAVEINLIGTTL